MFLKFCPAVALYHCTTVYGTSMRQDDGTTILLRAHTPRVSASSHEAQHPCANTSADCTKPERVAPEGCDERVMIDRLFHGPLGNEHFEIGVGRNIGV